MTLDIDIGDGADALTINQLRDALDGTYWSSGWDASTGSGDLEVDIESGEGSYDGSTVETGSTETVDFDGDVDSEDPRKATVYVDSNGSVQTSLGDPVAADPENEIRSRTYDPAPPADVDGVVVAEVWLDADTSGVVSDDIRDRRLTNVAAGTGTPSGVITMWSGAVSDIPSGWTLCDGSDGTPDLRNRFVVGADDEYEPDDTGGEKSVTLTTDEMPSHDHGGGDHSHSVSFYDDTGDGSDRIRGAFEEDGQESTTQTGGSGNIIDSAGDDQSHENRPPYYALAYIMKE